MVLVRYKGVLFVVIGHQVVSTMLVGSECLFHGSGPNFIHVGRLSGKGVYIGLELLREYMHEMWYQSTTYPQVIA